MAHIMLIFLDKYLLFVELLTCALMTHVSTALLHDMHITVIIYHILSYIWQQEILCLIA